MARVSPSNPPLFEHDHCGRCGGTGSYCRGTCFGCGGAGYKLTRRGAAAQAWFNRQRQVRAADLKVGDVYFSEGFHCGSFMQPNRWVLIESITTREDGSLLIVGHDKNRKGQQFADNIQLGTSPDSMIRKAQTNARLAELRKAALEYQATLGKHGKPLKAAKVGA